MDKKILAKVINKLFEEKGKRKFKQSVEIIFNFRNVDFSKPENRLNIDIVLPKGKGAKTPAIGVFGDEETLSEAKKAGATLLIPQKEIGSYTEKNKLNMLIKDYSLLAQPNQMSAIAKSLGQYLGARGKLPKPIIGNVKEAIEKAKKSIRIVTKGKNLPTVQAFIGTEEMTEEEIIENAEAVYDAIVKKIPDGNIKSIYMKLSMGKAIKLK